MPETQNETQVVVPNTPVLGTEAPNAQERAAIYDKLYGNTEQPKVETPPQQVQPNTNQAPALTAEALQAIVAEAVKAQLAANQPVATPPAAAAPPADWFNLLQDGKRTEAEQALIDKVTGGAKDAITRDAMVQALEVFTANNEINNFNAQVRSDNPDLLDVEEIIGLKAEQLFNQGLSKVKSTKEYTDLYKDSVNKSIDSVRTILQRTRAAAKAEERTTRREVLQTFTATPNRIVSVQEQSQQQAEQVPDNSPESYMAQRRAASAATRGL